MSERFGQQLLYLLTGVVLARVLDVEAFALIGMLSIFVSLSTILIDSGFSSALIREKEVPSNDYSSVLIFNVGAALALYLMLFFCAPFIAGFYNQPALIPVSRYLFISLIFNALGLVQIVLLIRKIDFKTQAKINVVALFISTSLSVVMALFGFGVWALASQPVLLSFFKTVFLWRNNKVKIPWHFQLSRLKKYLPFSINNFLTSSILAIFNNIYSIAIGRSFSSLTMGYYTQANKFAEMPNTLVNGPIQNIMYAASAAIQDDEERLKRATQKSFRTTCFVVLPIMLGLIVVAKPLLLILLGEKWANIVPYFQLICLANVIGAMATQNYTFLNTRGFSNIVLRLEIVKIILLSTTLTFTIKHGVIAMLFGLIAVRVASLFINAFFAGKRVNYYWNEQFRDMFPYVLMAAVMFVAAYSWHFVIANNYVLLITQLFTGAVVYILANELLGSTVYKDAKEMIVSQLKRLRFQ